MTQSLDDAARPFFESPKTNGDEHDAPRLLLISFHFPPDIAVGGLRWQQMAKYFVAKGWRLDVVTRDPSTLTVRDEGRLARLPPNVRVFGAAKREHPAATIPTRVWKIFRRRFPRDVTQLTVEVRRDELHKQSLALRTRRAYLAWLDFVHQGGWARNAARVATALMKSNSYVAVVTSGPPHMAHEAGRIVAKRAGIPLILDFRDPWSLQERVGEQMASPVWFKLAERYESAAVREAKVIAMNTDASRDAMRARYPEAAERIITVRNGCDDEPLPVVPDASRFTIRFAGEIYMDRNPRTLFRAAARVVNDLRLTPREFGLLFIGDVARFQGQPLEEIAQQEGLVGFVETGPFRPRDAALEFLAGGTMLLSLPQDARFAAPAKIYEYLRFNAWLLILTDEGSATASLLRGTEADVVDPHDVDGIARVIRHRYEQFARGERPKPVGADGRFDRKVQAELLLERIESVAIGTPYTARQAR